MVDQHNRLLNQKHSHELLEFSEHNDVQFCQKISRSYILQYILQDDNKKNDRDEFLTKDITQLLKFKKGKYWKYTRGIFHRFNERTKLKSKRRLIDTPIPKSTQQPIPFVHMEGNDSNFMFTYGSDDSGEDVSACFTT